MGKMTGEGRRRREYGDYQTPLPFACTMVEHIRGQYGFRPSLIIEPCCGTGNFLAAAELHYPGCRMTGIEIDKGYAEAARKRFPSAVIYNRSVFGHDWTASLSEPGGVLILGNPPWINSSELGRLGSANLPQKVNFKGYRGLEAVTGMSGFDISEHIILELLSQFAGKDFMLAMLCKRGTAFKIFGEMYRTGYASRSVGIVEFDARRVFGVSVPACLLVVDCSAGGVHMVQERIGIRSLEGDLLETAGYEGGRFFFSQGCHTFLDGECVFEWRQGIKHDCAAVCELEMRDGGYVNGLGEMADIEDELVYPLVKGGHIRDFREGEFRKYVLVTQKRSGMTRHG